MRFIAPPRVAFRRFLVASLAVCGMALLVACGDDASDKSPVQVAEESSSSVDEVLSSSANVEESSSSFESEGLSSSVESGASSSSEKSTESSSGKNTEPAEVSSCSVAEESSSSTTVEQSSSSVKIEQSSSSEKAEASSSSVKVQESSSSVKVEESSSSAQTDASSSSEKPMESSSSEKVEESSSSEVSSSSVVQPCKTKTEDNCIYGTLYDERDGKTYKTVKIGEQWWMAENLNYETDSLRPSARSVCHPDPDTCAKYGRLYFWNIAMDTLNTGCGKYVTCKPSEPVQGVCPKGWHIPSELEMIVLLNNVGGEKINAAQNLRASDSWTSPVKCSSIDPYGFSALAAGLYYNTNYQDFHAETRFTLSSEYDKERRKVLVITSYSSTELGCPKKTAEIEYFWNKSNTASVRCIKD